MFTEVASGVTYTPAMLSGYITFQQVVERERSTPTHASILSLLHPYQRGLLDRVASAYEIACAHVDRAGTDGMVYQAGVKSWPPALISAGRHLRTVLAR